MDLEPGLCKDSCLWPLLNVANPRLKNGKTNNRLHLFLMFWLFYIFSLFEDKHIFSLFEDKHINLKVGSCPDDDVSVQFYFLSFSV